MGDGTITGKVTFSFAPTQKVVPLKRDRRESEKRRFERQLKDEEESEAEDRVDVQGASQNQDGREDPEDASSSGDEALNEEAKKNLHESDSPVPGLVIDIRV
jgi:hypothetical protein